MAEAKEEQITRLLAEGLDHFGSGSEFEAIEAWRAVLHLDPHNDEARDYLRTVARTGGEGESELSESAVEAIGDEARQLSRRGDFEGAYDLLRSGVVEPGADLTLETFVDIVRVRLVRAYRRELGDLDSVPVLSQDGAELTQYNLPPNAGFMLSLLDGSTSLNDLITISGMDAFDALRTLRGLVNVGIVELRA